jgi:hypothetical protein
VFAKQYSWDCSLSNGHQFDGWNLPSHEIVPFGGHWRGNTIKKKVRFNDIFVGTGEGQHPGVIQWDLGKTIQGGKFARTGALNNPPTAFLTAITKKATRINRLKNT